MKDLIYTITGSDFFHKSLSREQRISGMKWDSRQHSSGRILSGHLFIECGYSVVEFTTRGEFTVNYQPEEAKGYIFIICQLEDANYIQLKTSNQVCTDYSPREIEMYVVPACSTLSVTYSAQTSGKRLEIFIDESRLQAMFTPAFVKMLSGDDALHFSNMLCECSYGKLVKTANQFFSDVFHETDIQLETIIQEMLVQFNEFAPVS